MEDYVGAWRLMQRDDRSGKVYWLQDRLTKRDAEAMWKHATKRTEENINIQYWIEPDVAGINFD